MDHTHCSLDLMCVSVDDSPGKSTWQCVSVKLVQMSSTLDTPSPQRSLTVTSLTFCFQSTNTSGDTNALADTQEQDFR